MSVESLASQEILLRAASCAVTAIGVARSDCPVCPSAYAFRHRLLCVQLTRSQGPLHRQGCLSKQRSDLNCGVARVAEKGCYWCLRGGVDG